MVSYHPVKFGGQRHCGSGDTMVIVVEGQDSTQRRLDRPLCLSLKHMAFHAPTQNFKM